MRRLVLLCPLVLLTALAPANDPNEVVRTPADVYKLLKPEAVQKRALLKIDANYGSQLAKLRGQKPKDYTIRRDALNDRYTRDFTLALTAIQKSDYRKYIRALRQGYIKAHPDVDADNIFIWGGANIL